MDDGGLASLLVLGFGLGLVHALDGDHVIAVTTLTSRRPSLRACLALAGRWNDTDLDATRFQLRSRPVEETPAKQPQPAAP